MNLQPSRAMELERGLARELTARQLTMIAIGGSSGIDLSVTVLKHLAGREGERPFVPLAARGVARQRGGFE